LCVPDIMLQGSGAFVYGIMSFTDKLSHGISVQAVQYFNPCSQYSNTRSAASCVACSGEFT